MTAFIRNHALLVYFVLACVFSWTMVALTRVSFSFALLALFGPAVAAILVTCATEGRRGVIDLCRGVTTWRVGMPWYVLAIGVPLLVAVVAQAAHAIVIGGPVGSGVGTPLPLTVVLALLVIGEEIGWRGFALPRLLRRFNGLAASLILGSIWACWHLANATIPGLEAYWSSFPGIPLFRAWRDHLLHVDVEPNSGLAADDVDPACNGECDHKPVLRG
jgi:membrane protease YdiL (CAAX protease family)